MDFLKKMNNEQLIKTVKYLCIALFVVVLVIIPVIFYLTSKGEKNEWPELKGVKKECAEKIISNDRPDLKIVYGIEGTAYMTAYNKNQVRIVYNADTGLVVEIPKIG